MTGMTGLRLLHLGSKDNVVGAHSGLVTTIFPQKTTVTSAQLNDHLGRPTYRKDIKV
jgi:hypothetical protein